MKSKERETTTGSLRKLHCLQGLQKGIRACRIWFESPRTKSTTLSVTTVGPHRLTVVVENMGRVNFGVAEDFIQHKGLSGTILFDSKPIKDFNIYAAEFKGSWVQRSEQILNCR